SPLQRQEAEQLPLFMQETWLGVRIRAKRKVTPEQRLQILTGGALPPLHWIQEHCGVLSAVALGCG
ncbi:MAG: hypothetical protein H5T97_12805, partial [Firmicutes bacterium]|nr:hypothetical protein [Bacillota bacterium]